MSHKQKLEAILSVLNSKPKKTSKPKSMSMSKPKPKGKGIEYYDSEDEFEDNPNIVNPVVYDSEDEEIYDDDMYQDQEENSDYEDPDEESGFVSVNDIASGGKKPSKSEVLKKVQEIASGLRNKKHETKLERSANLSKAWKIYKQKHGGLMLGGAVALEGGKRGGKKTKMLVCPHCKGSGLFDSIKNAITDVGTQLYKKGQQNPQ